MVQIEVEQGVPAEFKSFYSSNSQPGQNPVRTADQLNGKGPPVKNLNIITKDDPEPEPTRPNYKFPLVKNNDQIPTFVDLSSPKGMIGTASTSRGPKTLGILDDDDGYDLDQIMQEKENRKKLEAQKNQTYLSPLLPSGQLGSSNSIGRKPSPNTDFVNRLSKASPRRYNRNTIEQVNAEQ